MSKAAALPRTTIDVYDFDKTIYDGDCSLDFYRFCLRKKPLTVRYLPAQIWHLVLLILNIEDRSAFKTHFFSFLRSQKDVPELVDTFWKGRDTKIKQWYVGADHGNNVIISASPEFLLRPIAEKLRVPKLIATRMDPATGKIKGRNCRGDEKVARLREAMGDVNVRRAYTDSLSDMPILSLAKEKYIVRGDKILSLDAFLKRSMTENASVPDPLD